MRKKSAVNAGKASVSHHSQVRTTDSRLTDRKRFIRGDMCSCTQLCEMHRELLPQNHYFQSVVPARKPFQSRVSRLALCLGATRRQTAADFDVDIGIDYHLLPSAPIKITICVVQGPRDGGRRAIKNAWE